MATTESRFNELPSIALPLEVIADSGTETGRANMAALKAALAIVSGDVGGFDAAVKAAVLAYLAAGANVTITQVAGQLVIAATGGGGGGGGLSDGNYGDVTVSGSGTIIAINTNAVAYSELSGRPTLGTASALNVAASGNASATEVVKGNDTRLSAARNFDLYIPGTIANGVAFKYSARFAGTITAVTSALDAGTCTAAVTIGGAALGGGSSSVTTTEATVTHSSANAQSISSLVAVTVSSASSASGLRLSITVQPT